MMANGRLKHRQNLSSPLKSTDLTLNHTFLSSFIPIMGRSETISKAIEICKRFQASKLVLFDFSQRNDHSNMIRVIIYGISDNIKKGIAFFELNCLDDPIDVNFVDHMDQIRLKEYEKDGQIIFNRSNVT